MSRSGYTDDVDDSLALGRWRGRVASAIRGKRGQAFLREMLAAFDALPEKRLIKHELVCEEGCCAMGSVALARGLDVAGVDPEDPEQVAPLFDIAEVLVQEIAFLNDEECEHSTPEDRFESMRRWIVSQIKEPTP